jgi:hypothetical protein
VIVPPGNASFKEFFWTKSPERIRLRFGSVTPGGTAVQILWSDRFEGCHRIDSNAVLTLRAPQAPGFQVLEARPLLGARVALVEARVLR